MRRMIMFHFNDFFRRQVGFLSLLVHSEIRDPIPERGDAVPDEGSCGVHGEGG